jgi:CRP/FNR family cyclic AMP-dependent transcriptional regulator
MARASQLTTSKNGTKKRAIKAPPASSVKPPLSPFDAQIFLNTLGAGRSVATYKKGDAIFLQGNPADAVFYIQRGQIQISVVSEHGKEGVVAVLGEGDFFGEGCLAGQPLHISTAIATATAMVISISRESMARILRDEPAMSALFMTFLLSRNVQAEADLIDHLFNSSERRLARILLLLTSMGKDGTMQSIPAINQDVLAARVGTTRSRINTFMNKFRKLGFIDYDKATLKVHSSLLNIIVHD